MPIRSQVSNPKLARQTILFVAGVFFLFFGVQGFNGKSDWNPIVFVTEETAEGITNAALPVYVSLRAINAALSTAQEVEVGASVVGQASFQPLKGLEPVDDTVERVADAVFFVAAGSALARVGLAPVVSVGFLLLGLGLLGKAAIGMLPKSDDRLKALCTRSANFGFAVGIVAPSMFVLGVWASELSTDTKLKEAQKALDNVSQQADALIGIDTSDAPVSSAMEDDDLGVLGWLRNRITELRDGVRGIFENGNRYLDAANVFLDKADTILNASLTIIGILVLRMFVLPILLFFGVLAFLRSTLRDSG